MNPEKSDDSRSARLRKGDQDALAGLIEEYQSRLLAFISRAMSDRLKQKVEPADILQEMSVTALDSLDSYDLADREPFSWLCQVAERRIVDAHRRHFSAQKRDANRERALNQKVGGGSQQEFLDLLVTSMTTPSAVFSRDQKELLLHEAIAQLPELPREALRMRYLEGMPSREIASRLGKTDGAIRVLLTRTLRKLQDDLGEHTWFRPT